MLLNACKITLRMYINIVFISLSVKFNIFVFVLIDFSIHSPVYIVSSWFIYLFIYLCSFIILDLWLLLLYYYFL